MKYPALILISLALALTTLPAVAEDTPAASMVMPMDGKAVAESYPGLGIINSVDAKAGKINLTNAPIAALGWPGMTMDFEAQDKASLTKLKPGQKVAFKLIEAGKGKYVISEIALIK